MILTLQIHPCETKAQIQDDSAAANSSLRKKNSNPGLFCGCKFIPAKHKHKSRMILTLQIHPCKTKMQIQDDSATANSSPRNKNANPG